MHLFCFSGCRWFSFVSICSKDVQVGFWAEVNESQQLPKRPVNCRSIFLWNWVRASLRGVVTAVNLLCRCSAKRRPSGDLLMSAVFVGWTLRHSPALQLFVFFHLNLRQMKVLHRFYILSLQCDCEIEVDSSSASRFYCNKFGARLRHRIGSLALPLGINTAFLYCQKHLSSSSSSPFFSFHHVAERGRGALFSLFFSSSSHPTQIWIFPLLACALSPVG